MIIIEEKDFKMVQSIKTSPFFDLYLPYIVNEGKSNQREEMKLFGYGMSFEACIDILIKKKLSEKKDSYSIEEYLKSYIDEIKEVKKLIKYDFNETANNSTKEL